MSFVHEHSPILLDKTNSNEHLMLFWSRKKGKKPRHISFSMVHRDWGKRHSPVLLLPKWGSLRITSGPAIEKAGDLAALLSNLQEGDVFFRWDSSTPKTCRRDALLCTGRFRARHYCRERTGARSLRIQLPKFTFVAATTRLWWIVLTTERSLWKAFDLNFMSQKI